MTKETSIEPELIAGLRPLLPYLNERDAGRFCHLAFQSHPVSGRPRQDQVMLSTAPALGVTHRTFRLSTSGYKMGETEFSSLAKEWYEGSYEFAGLFMRACRAAGWKVRTHWTDPNLVGKGYIWVARR